MNNNLPKRDISPVPVEITPVRENVPVPVEITPVRENVPVPDENIGVTLLHNISEPKLDRDMAKAKPRIRK